MTSSFNTERIFWPFPTVQQHHCHLNQLLGQDPPQNNSPVLEQEQLSQLEYDT